MVTCGLMMANPPAAKTKGGSTMKMCKVYFTKNRSGYCVKISGDTNATMHAHTFKDAWVMLINWWRKA